MQIYRYVSEGSFDAYMWQTLETKAKFIAQVMSGDMTVRRLEDLDSAALTYAEVKAIASGNPLVIEKAQVDAELIRLTRLRSAHAEEQYRIRSNLRHAHEDAQTFTVRLTNRRQDIAVRQDTSGDNFRIEFDGQTLDNRGIAGELEGKVGAPFEHEERHHSLTRRQQEIAERLDLTRNLAPGASDSDVAQTQNASELDMVNSNSQHDDEGTKRQIKQRRGVRV